MTRLKRSMRLWTWTGRRSLCVLGRTCKVRPSLSELSVTLVLHLEVPVQSHAQLSLMSFAWVAVLKLGRIEWMRPTYHSKKHIFPIGYSAVRAVELSATRGHMVQCLCEIGESADSLEPVFRYSSIVCNALRRVSDLLDDVNLVPSDHMNDKTPVTLSSWGLLGHSSVMHRVTPESGPAEEASNPTKAWRALLERHGLAKRAAGLSGLRMFGLDTPTVAKLIQSLPHAARCTSFEAWTSEKPDPVPLVSMSETL